MSLNVIIKVSNSTGVNPVNPVLQAPVYECEEYCNKLLYFKDIPKIALINY